MKNITSINRFALGFALASIVAVSVPAFAFASTINRELSLGMSGSDVSVLQGFLAQDATVYPQGLITGYFGGFTKTAVANYQAQNSMPSVGRVGPMTLQAINTEIDRQNNAGQVATIGGVTVSASTNSATVGWGTDEAAKGVVYYSSAPLITTEHANSVDVSGASVMTDANFRTSQNVSIVGLTHNTTYYYMVYVTDQTGNVSVTWPASFITAN